MKQYAKKFRLTVFCVLCSFFAFAVGVTVYAQETATPTTQRVMLNGQPIQIAGYNIRGINYFKLRDLAYALNGTAVQFNMSWDEISMTARIYTNTPYSPIGGELQYVPASSAYASIADTVFFVDGGEILLSGQGGISVGDGSFHGVSGDSFHPLAVIINSDVFVQLRLIGDLIGFSTGFVHSDMTILINTNEMRDYYRGLNTVQRFLLNFLQTGVSEMYYMALDADGNLWAWWDNFYTFQAREDDWSGIHRPIIRTQTQPDIIMKNVIDFATSPMGGYAFAITADNVLWGWGFNEHGQLGDGTKENRFEPVKIREDVAFVDTSWVWGGKSTLIITTCGQLWEWGFVEDRGHDGLSPFLGILGQRPPTLIMEDVIKISRPLMNTYTVAITSDGVLWGWGVNAHGVLLDETAIFIPRNAPVRLLDDVIYVSTDGVQISAIRSDNSLWTWGAGSLGNLFNESTANHEEPTRVMENVAFVNVNSQNASAIKRDNSLWTPVWRGNNHPPVNVRVLEGVIWSDSSGNWIITSCGNLHRARIVVSESLRNGYFVEFVNRSTVDDDVVLPNIISASLYAFRALMHRLPEYPEGE